jgi:hypothetical protein
MKDLQYYEDFLNNLSIDKLVGYLVGFEKGFIILDIDGENIKINEEKIIYNNEEKEIEKKNVRNMVKEIIDIYRSCGY